MTDEEKYRILDVPKPKVIGTKYVSEEEKKKRQEDFLEFINKMKKIENYEVQFEAALEKLHMWYELPYENEKALRNALWSNYENEKLDPDGRLVRYVEGIPCSADALLSIYRICVMEDDVENIIPTFERYRKEPIFFFPRENGGINQTRAAVFCDKIDFTLLDIKRFYLHQECQMQKTFERAKTRTWLNSMQSFENIVDWYGIKGIFVDEDYHVINIETGEVFDESVVNIPDRYWSKTYYDNIKKYSDMWNKKKGGL